MNIPNSGHIVLFRKMQEEIKKESNDATTKWWICPLPAKIIIPLIESLKSIVNINIDKKEKNKENFMCS